MHANNKMSVVGAQGHKGAEGAGGGGILIGRGECVWLPLPLCEGGYPSISHLSGGGAAAMPPILTIPPMRLRSQSPCSLTGR